MSMSASKAVSLAECEIGDIVSTSGDMNFNHQYEIVQFGLLRYLPSGEMVPYKYWDRRIFRVVGSSKPLKVEDFL